jgi:hypothetical protein
MSEQNHIPTPGERVIAPDGAAGMDRLRAVARHILAVPKPPADAKPAKSPATKGGRGRKPAS